MLYLLDKDVRTVRWNGEPLHEATSAIVKETMNGDFTLTVKYPISDSGIYQLIQEDMLIKAPTPVLGAQLFRIKKPIEHNDHLEITAYHISDDVMQRSITPMSVTSQSCGMALSRMVQNTKTALGDFSFNSDIQDRRTFNTTETETLYSVLLDGKHSIVGTWEGELVRDNFAMTVKKSRGENRGVVITTHKNLKDYQRTKNSQNVVTRIHAKSTFKPEGAEKETTIRVTVDSPLINSYPYINEKEYENNNAKSVEELQKWAQSKFSNEGIDKVSDAIKIEAYELDGQVVHMGDTVNLKSWKHNVDAFKKAIAYEFDALKEEYISLTFDDKAWVGVSRASGGLSSAADAILGVTESAQEIALEKALQNADLDFDHQAGLLRQEILDGIELARAKAEEIKRELSDTINQRFDNFDNASIQEAKHSAEEALKKSGANEVLANEAKTIADQLSAKMNQFKQESNKAQRDLSENVNHFKSELQQSLAGKADNVTVEQTERALRQKFESLSTDTLGKINAAKTEFEKTAQGLSTKITNVETYVNSDGQRQDDLKRYAREESASQARAVREDVTRDFVGKNTFQESVQGVERRLESLSLGTSGNLLKNSNKGFYNQHDKRYRLVETLQANQVYTLVSKYWHGENSTNHTFYDGVGKWQRLNYNKAIDAWMVQFTPTQEIPAGTEIILSAVPNEAKGNMSWATLVRGAIPLIHWQPAKGDVEEGVTQKLAEYKETVDGRFATISSQINGKANQSDFQRVKETSQLYERILGGSGSSDQTVKDNVARLVMTNQLFQTEVGRYSGNGVNRAINTTSDWGPFITRSGNDGVNLHADLHKILSNGFKAGDTAHVRMEISIDSVQRFNDKQIVAILQSYGDVTNWARAGRTFDYNIGNLQPGNNWRLIEFDTVMTGEMLKNNSWMLNLRVDGASSYKVHTKSVKVEKGNVASAWSPAPEDTDEAIRTVQTQLAGSWAVQNINSSGDIISGINLGANGHNRITGKLTHITGETLIDNAVIKSAMVDKLKTANFESGSVTTTILDAEAVTADKVKMDEAFANKLVASDTFTNTLTAKRGFINQLVSNNTFTNELTAQRGFIQKLVSNDVFTNDLTAKRGFIHQLASNNIFTNELAAQRGFINQLQSKIINTETLDAFRGRIGGFNLGPFPQGGGRWIAGNNPYICGMGNGEGGGVRTAFWANWGSNWNQAGWGSWVVTTDGKMSCKNDVSFYHKADFSNTCTVNFYSKPNATRGIWTGDGEINGSGSNPGGGQNAVVWWNQITTGKWRQHAGITTASDRRLKENIEPTSVKALNKIKDLNLVAFDYIKNKSHEEIGLIAQEVSDIVPNAVSEYEGEDSHLTINYAKFIPYLLKAIQELNQKIEKMEKTIA